MPQLKDDCFAFGGRLTSLGEVLADLEQRIESVCHTQTAPLKQALGRIVAEDIVAPRPVPPHDNSAVDGYAVYYDDLNLKGDTSLPVVGRATAGHPLTNIPERGTAVRIFTGAPMPRHTHQGDSDGPDTVFMEEDCTVKGDTVIVPAGLARGSNRRFAGEDLQIGATVLRAGHPVRAQDAGLLASVGITAVPVKTPLRVALFSTGDELCDVSEPRIATGCVYDANRYSLYALLQGMGCAVTDMGIIKDDQAVLTDALAMAAEEHHLIITSGGISAGAEDHVKNALTENSALRGSLYHWRLAIKPGRPIALGQLGTAAFIGLPGNPVAAMVTFLMVARILIKRLQGAVILPLPYMAVQADFPYKKKAGRREWVRVRLMPKDMTGDMPLSWRACKDHGSGAGILSSMTHADGLVELPEDATQVAPGDLVAYIPFTAFYA